MSRRTAEACQNLKKNIKEPVQKISENRISYYCPKCKKPLILKKKRRNSSNTFCKYCDQQIYVESGSGVGCVTAIARNLEEARYLFDLYKELNGTAYKISIEEWLKKDRAYPLELYFVFPDHKNYSKFVKRATQINGLALMF